MLHNFENNLKSYEKESSNKILLCEKKKQNVKKLFKSTLKKQSTGMFTGFGVN